MDSYFPNEFELEYLVYKASDSLTEEKEVWDMRFSEVIRRLLFKKFDNWAEGEIIGRQS